MKELEKILEYQEKFLKEQETEKNKEKKEKKEKRDEHQSKN